MCPPLREWLDLIAGIGALADEAAAALCADATLQGRYVVTLLGVSVCGRAVDVVNIGPSAGSAGRTKTGHVDEWG